MLLNGDTFYFFGRLVVDIELGKASNGGLLGSDEGIASFYLFLY